MANRKLIVEVVGDSRSFEKSLDRSTRAAKQFSIGIGTIVKSAVIFGAVTKGMDLLGNAIHASISEFSEQQKVAAQTAAVIKSQGDVAGVTAKHVDKLAESISQLSGIDDEVVQSGENILLTFRNIRNVAGAPIFDQATQSATDMSVAMGIDLPKAALQIGKALNDPIRGLARLQRIGVQFSADQVSLIKHFEETGQTAKAQGVILRELQREFGGSAKALGETVPGALNRIRETFRNIGGDIVSALAPGLQKGLDSVADFVDKIGKAHGAKAKVQVAFEGIQNLGRDLFKQITDTLAAIDWPAAVKVVQDGLLEGLRRIAEFLNQIDWAAVARAISNGLATGLQGVAAFLQSVDWGIVGNRIVEGVRTFLENVNWKALLVGVFKLLIAAAKAEVALYRGIGKALAEAIWDGLRAALDALGPLAEQAALKLALKILKPLDFKILGRHVIPGLNSLVKTIEGKLDELAQNAEDNADRIAAAAGKAAGSVNRSAAIVDQPAPKPAPTRKPATEADLTPAKTPKAAPTGPTPKERQRKRFDDLIAAIGLQVDRDAAANAFKKSLRDNQKLQDAIRAQIKVEGKTTELMRMLFDAQDARRTLIKDHAAAAEQKQTADLFKKLGLTAEGDKPIPTVSNLKKQLTQLTHTLGSNITPRLAAQLSQIGRVLSGRFGKVTQDVREKIRDMLSGIRSDIDKGVNGGDVIQVTPATVALNRNKILAGLGLDRETERTIRARLAGFTQAGTKLSPAAGTHGAFGIVITPQPVTVHTTVNLDGQKVAKNTTVHQGKAKRSNPPQKRGWTGGWI